MSKIRQARSWIAAKIDAAIYDTSGVTIFSQGRGRAR